MIRVNKNNSFSDSVVRTRALIILKNAVVLIFLFALQSGCINCGNEGTPPYYSVEGYHAEIQRISVYHASTGHYETTNTNDSIMAGTEFSIRLAAGLSYYGCNRGLSIGKLFACDPLSPGYKGTTDRIDSLLVVSNAAVNQQLPAGSSLNHLFDVGIANQFVSSLNQWPGSTPAESPQYFDLLMTAPPDAGVVHQFTIRIWLAGGEIFESATGDIAFQ